VVAGAQRAREDLIRVRGADLDRPHRPLGLGADAELLRVAEAARRDLLARQDRVGADEPDDLIRAGDRARDERRPRNGQRLRHVAGDDRRPGRPGRDVRGGDEHVDVLCAVLYVLSVIGDVDGHEHGGEQAEHDGHYDIPELIRHVIPRVVGGSIPIKELS
jgi:hypothetical protein